MKKFILLLFLTGSIQLFSQEKPTFYLLFEEGAKGTCEFRPNPVQNNLINLPYIQKRYRKVGVTWFFLCKQQFIFEFKTDYFKVISAEEAQKIQKTTVQDLLNFRYQNNATLTPQDLVEQIFLVEAIEDNQYAIYGVRWKDQDR